MCELQKHLSCLQNAVNFGTTANSLSVGAEKSERTLKSVRPETKFQDQWALKSAKGAAHAPNAELARPDCRGLSS